MSFENFIRNNFDRVLSLDTEFRMDATKTIPEKVVCFCYEDIFTGETWKFWEHDKPSCGKTHFDNSRNLIVSYVATAEIGCMINLNHEVPNNIFDSFVEIKRLYLDRRERGKFSLLDTAQCYGILDKMTKDQKTDTRDLIINNTSYTPEQREIILDYCMEDVKLNSKVFLEIIRDIERKNKLKTEEDYRRELWQCMFRGAAIAAVARIEKNGFPIDMNKLNLFNQYWNEVKDNIILKFNQDIDCFDGTVFNNKKFENLIIGKLGLTNWPRLFKSGQLSTNKKILADYAERFPEIKKLLEIRTLQNMTKLNGYQISSDGRARTSLNMCGTVTGRCAPSTAKFPFSTAKWARNFIRAPWGSVLVYMDYSQQEVAIQGYLSGDEKLIEAYNTGDVYVKTGKLCKMIPDHGTKQTHPKERAIFKVLFLANSYGAGENWIADQLKCDLPTARYYKKLFRRIYKKYFYWIQNFIDNGFLRGKMTTAFGWQRFISSHLKRDKNGKIVGIKNSIQNWPIQSTGSDILRQAILDLSAAHIKIVAPVHDALLLEIPKPELDTIKEARELMINAAIKVVGGPIRVDYEVIENNFRQEEKDQKIFDEIFKEIEIFISNSKGLTPGQEPLSKRCEVRI